MRRVREREGRLIVVMPNFFIIGAQKAGTTSLYYYLSQHPEIYMSPVKEPHFFAYQGEKPQFRGPADQNIVDKQFTTDAASYRDLFRGVSSEKAVGEASAIYIYSPVAPLRMRSQVPDAKIIAILRNPVDRAYSSFLHLVKEGREPETDFAQALQMEESRIRDGWIALWHYKQAGFYHRQLQRYFEVFERDQIRVYLYEDLQQKPAELLKDAFSFLGVDSSFVPDISARYNVTGILPDNKALYALHTFLMRPPRFVKAALKPLLPQQMRERALDIALDGLRKQAFVKAPEVSPNVRRELIDLYREDVLELQGLIRRDLSGWLN